MDNNVKCTVLDLTLSRESVLEKTNVIVYAYSEELKKSVHINVCFPNNTAIPLIIGGPITIDSEIFEEGNFMN